MSIRFATTNIKPSKLERLAALGTVLTLLGLSLLLIPLKGVKLNGKFRDECLNLHWPTQTASLFQR